MQYYCIKITVNQNHNNSILIILTSCQRVNTLELYLYEMLVYEIIYCNNQTMTRHPHRCVFIAVKP